MGGIDRRWRFSLIDEITAALLWNKRPADFDCERRSQIRTALAELMARVRVY